VQWRQTPEAGQPAEVVVFLLPYRGDRPGAELTPERDGWELRLKGAGVHTFAEPGSVTFRASGAVVWHEGLES